MSDTAAPTRDLQLRWGLAILLAVELALCIWLCRDFYPVGYYNDDAAFLCQARNFVSSGNLYQAPWHPLDGLPLHPPGQALVLSPWVWLSPHNVGLLQGVAAAMTLVTAALLGAWIRPRLGWAGACLIATVYVANGPCATHASTLMADVSAGCLTVASLWYADRRLCDLPSALLLGLVVGFSMLIRASSAFTLVAIGAALMCQRRWSQAVTAAVGAAMVYLPYYLVQRVSPDAALLGTDLSAMGAHRSHLLLYAWDWTLALWRLLGDQFIHVGAWSAPVLLLAAAVGGLRRWRQEHSVMPWFLFVYMACMMAWPYPSPRYYLVWWPLLVVLACGTLPRSWALGGLALVACLALPGLDEKIQLARIVPERTLSLHDAEFFIRDHSRPDATLITNSAFQAFLYADRRAYGCDNSVDVADYTRQVAQDNPTFCLVDHQNLTAVDVQGNPQGVVVRHLCDWLDHSTLYRKLYDSGWQGVYRLTVPRGRFLLAWRDYQAALQDDAAHQTGAEIQSLVQCLARTPDFPPARNLLAVEWLSHGSHVPEAIALLRHEFEQYPMDAAAGVDLALAEEQAGQHRQSQQDLLAARDAAARWGDQQAFRAASDRLPSR